MSKFSLYNVPLPDTLSEVQEYEYKLDDKFFTMMKDEDSVEINKGTLAVKLSLKQRADEYEMMFDIEGSVKVPCDRCLDDVAVEVSTKDRLVVKLGDGYSDESEDIVVIPRTETSINVAWFLFEFIALSLPIKNVHEQGKCNRQMSSKFDKHKTEQAEEDEEEETEEDSKSESDPRWDALKDLGSSSEE